MNELDIDAALVSVLRAGTALAAVLASGTASIYNLLAPEGTTYPLVIFQLQSGLDDHSSPGRGKNMLYTVKGISTTSWLEAGTVDAQVDSLLEGGTISVSGWSNWYLYRESSIRYYEFDAATHMRYYHVGGMYRIKLSDP